MLSIDFANLAKLRPDLADVWQAIAHWIGENPRASFIDIRELARHPDVPGDPERIAMAVMFLISDGGLKRVYKVVNPATNQFLPGEWSSLLDIPERLRDSAENSVDVGEARIVPILQDAKSGTGRYRGVYRNGGGRQGYG